MKKLLLVFLVAGTFAACNSNSNSESTKQDSSTVQTPATTTPTQDTTKKTVDTASKAATVDTTKKGK
ncbi:MAG: hypothetical protein IT214_10180 [Chitinophagaceae bacterium]|jgi:uncharacterized protein YcfL|nr:hypothetical protein [Chitinophagaceae bacterium]OQY93074.1 MAG: hypothetical protein B6D37_12420 [Sphingobacteriales bacterium UTBCD1]